MIKVNFSIVSIVNLSKLHDVYLGWIDLPDPVKNFHATYVQDSKISLSWDPVLRKSKYVTND